MTVAFWVCLSILILTQIADYWSSKVAMRNPKAQEGNWIVRKIGLLPAKLVSTSLLTWCAYLLAFVSTNIGLLVLITVVTTAFYTWVVVNNLTVAKR